MKILHPLLDEDNNIVEGGVAIVIPPEDSQIPIEELARKDVPAGLPFLIVEDDVVPTDRIFRGAWTADFSEPHGYGIGAEAWFAEQAALYEEQISDHD